MKRSKFTEDQIAFALKQAELGTSVADVCRKLGISDATFYVWKKKYSGVGPSELGRLRQLEEEIHPSVRDCFRPASDRRRRLHGSCRGGSEEPAALSYGITLGSLSAQADERLCFLRCGNFNPKSLQCRFRANQ